MMTTLRLYIYIYIQYCLSHKATCAEPASRDLLQMIHVYPMIRTTRSLLPHFMRSRSHRPLTLYGLEHYSRFLHTALRFYEFALTLTKTRMHHVFDLALLSSNIGQIYHEIFDFDKKSLQCIQYLFQTLQCVLRPMDASDYRILLNLTVRAPNAAAYS
jgi:hypothetical protein